MKPTRDLTYAFRLTERERRTIEAGAKRSRKPLGDFVREAALGEAARNRRNGRAVSESVQSEGAAPRASRDSLEGATA